MEWLQDVDHRLLHGPLSLTDCQAMLAGVAGALALALSRASSTAT